MKHSSGNLKPDSGPLGRYGNSIVLEWRHAGIFLREKFRLNLTEELEAVDDRFCIRNLSTMQQPMRN